MTLLCAILMFIKASMLEASTEKTMYGIFALLCFIIYYCGHYNLNRKVEKLEKLLEEVL